MEFAWLLTLQLELLAKQLVTVILGNTVTKEARNAFFNNKLVNFAPQKFNAHTVLFVISTQQPVFRFVPLIFQFQMEARSQEKTSFRITSLVNLVTQSLFKMVTIV